METTMSVQLGINPLTWTNDDLPSLGAETPLETCLSEGKEAGFAGGVSIDLTYMGFSVEPEIPLANTGGSSCGGSCSSGSCGTH